jgi:ParB-like chromosome segregation protein Spo0J
MNQIEYVKLSELSLSRDNPRKITKDKFRQLCNDIKEDPSFLECRPILVYVEDDEKIVYAGNQRVRACKELKYHQVPCIIDKKENLSDEQIRRRIIIDNRHAGEFDYDELANNWDLNELLVLGFDPKEFDLCLEDKPKKEKKTEIEKCPHCGKEI